MYRVLASHQKNKGLLSGEGIEGRRVARFSLELELQQLSKLDQRAKSGMAPVLQNEHTHARRVSLKTMQTARDHSWRVIEERNAHIIYHSPQVETSIVMAMICQAEMP